MSEKVFGYVQSLELAARYEYSQFGCSSILEGKTIGHAIHVRVQLYERSYSSVSAEIRRYAAMSIDQP